MWTNGLFLECTEDEGDMLLSSISIVQKELSHDLTVLPVCEESTLASALTDNAGLSEATVTLSVLLYWSIDPMLINQAEWSCLFEQQRYNCTLIRSSLTPILFSSSPLQLWILMNRHSFRSQWVSVRRRRTRYSTTRSHSYSRPSFISCPLVPVTRLYVVNDTACVLSDCKSLASSSSSCCCCCCSGHGWRGSTSAGSESQ